MLWQKNGLSMIGNAGEGMVMGRSGEGNGKGCGFEWGGQGRSY